MALIATRHIPLLKVTTLRRHHAITAIGITTGAAAGNLHHALAMRVTMAHDLNPPEIAGIMGHRHKSQKTKGTMGLQPAHLVTRDTMGLRQPHQKAQDIMAHRLSIKWLRIPVIPVDRFHPYSMA